MNRAKLQVLHLHDDSKTPVKSSAQAVGYDVYAYGNHVVRPGEIAKIPTGIKVKVSDAVYGSGLEYEIQVRSRSGYASKGIVVANSPGTIDPDYRGELFILLANLSDSKFDVEDGDRIAQLVIHEMIRSDVSIVDESAFDDTERGSGGFGSTGK